MRKGRCTWSLLLILPMVLVVPTVLLASPRCSSLLLVLVPAWSIDSSLAVLGPEDSKLVFARRDPSRWVPAMWLWLYLPPGVICELPVSVLVKLVIWIWSIVGDDWENPCFCVGCLIPCGDCDDSGDCGSASWRACFLVLPLLVELVPAIRLE